MVPLWIYWLFVTLSRFGLSMGFSRSRPLSLQLCSMENDHHFGVVKLFSFWHQLHFFIQQFSANFGHPCCKGVADVLQIRQWQDSIIYLYQIELLLLFLISAANVAVRSEIAVAEPNAMGVQLDAERADFLLQLEHLKGRSMRKSAKYKTLRNSWRKCNLTHLVAWKQKICQVLFWLHVFNAEAWVCSVTFTVSLLTVFHSNNAYVFKAWLGCCFAKPQADWGLLGALLPVPMQP